MQNTQKRNATHQVFILDIDGTLMPSNQIDDECYWQAVDEVIGGAREPPDLHDFANVTDSGILLEWMQGKHDRTATEHEQLAIRERFLELLMNAQSRHPELFRPMPGLLAWLDACRKLPGFSLAIATGGWAHSARFKLSVAGLDQFDFPLATSDDDISRAVIMEIALQRAHSGGERAPGKTAYTSVTYIGDGIWDYLASKELGWKFIGIAAGAQARMLGAAGASRIHENFKQMLDSSGRPAS